MGARVKRLTYEELVALPVTVDVETAGLAWGMGRTKAYELARAQEFPCPVRPLGHRLVVTKVALFESLGLKWEPAAAA